MQQIVVNTRILSSPLVGTRRYTEELLARWNGCADTIAPQSSLHGIRGHAWEQFVVPAKLGGRLLFSPSNSGPLATENQVITIHDMAAFDCPEAFSRTFAQWYRYLLPRVANRAKHVIAVSEFVKERIIAHTGVSSHKVTVVPNGFSSSFSPHAALPANEITSRLRLPSTTYVLVVGSLEPRKNLARLFQAWAQIQDQLPAECWLVVVGSVGTARVFKKASLDGLPARVFLAGYVDDEVLPALYAGATALAYISIYEGFGLPALEAMASGTPVLVGNCSSLPEVVGDAAVLVNPFDVNDIAAGLARIVVNAELRRTLREQGIVRAKRFSWDEAARKTWEILQAASSG